MVIINQNYEKNSKDVNYNLLNVTVIELLIWLALYNMATHDVIFELLNTTVLHDKCTEGYRHCS